jgi:hypothetical protein
MEDDEDMSELEAEQTWDNVRPELIETDPKNFLGDAHTDLTSSRKDTWNAWVTDWTSEKLNPLESLGRSKGDPILEALSQKNIT